MAGGGIQVSGGGIRVKNGGIVVASAGDPCCCDGGGGGGGGFDPPGGICSQINSMTCLISVIYTLTYAGATFSTACCPSEGSSDCCGSVTQIYPASFTGTYTQTVAGNVLTSISDPGGAKTICTTTTTCTIDGEESVETVDSMGTMSGTVFMRYDCPTSGDCTGGFFWGAYANGGDNSACGVAMGLPEDTGCNTRPQYNHTQSVLVGYNVDCDGNSTPVYMDVTVTTTFSISCS